MNPPQKRYVPALGYSWLTPLYDTTVRWTTREATFKSALLLQAAPGGGMDVLDLACGTGTLTIWCKQRFPTARITGVDGDPDVLARARRKAQAAGAEIAFVEGLATALPDPAGRYDRVLSSLFFHHLDRDGKRRALAEVFRVLKPGGQVHIADWGRARTRLMRLAYVGIQLLDGFDNTADNVNGLLPDFMHEAGFVEIVETVNFPTMFGTLSLYRAAKPD